MYVSIILPGLWASISVTHSYSFLWELDYTYSSNREIVQLLHWLVMRCAILQLPEALESCCAWSLWELSVHSHNTWNPVTHKHSCYHKNIGSGFPPPSCLACTKPASLSTLYELVPCMVCVCYPGCLRSRVCARFQFSSSCVEIHSACSHRLAGFTHVHIHTVLIVTLAAVRLQGRREGQVVYIHNQSYSSNQVIAFLTNWIRSFRSNCTFLIRSGDHKSIQCHLQLAVLKYEIWV